MKGFSELFSCGWCQNHPLTIRKYVVCFYFLFFCLFLLEKNIERGCNECLHRVIRLWMVPKSFFVYEEVRCMWPVWSWLHFGVLYLYYKRSIQQYSRLALWQGPGSGTCVSTCKNPIPFFKTFFSLMHYHLADITLFNLNILCLIFLTRWFLLTGNETNWQLSSNHCLLGLMIVLLLHDSKPVFTHPNVSLVTMHGPINYFYNGVFLSLVP